MDDPEVELAAVGDTRPGVGGDVRAGYQPPDAMFEKVKDSLRRADLRFAQVESVFAERGNFQLESMGDNSRLHPRMAEPYRTVPFDVVSLASNHTGDWGPEAVEDTIDTFHGLGIATIGVGRNLSEAHKPAILTAKGLRIAFLAYCSVVLPQNWATEQRAGLAPIRVRTHYEPYEFQPGAPPRIVTIPERRDVDRMIEDVHLARQEADCVVVSMHWGVHHIPKPLTDYQPVLAHAAIDAGASVILGHHPHLLQGIDLYRGGVVFYGLGNFAFFRLRGAPPRRTLPHGDYTFDLVYDKDMEPGYKYRFNQFWGESIVALIQLDATGVKKAALMPSVMNSQDQAEIVSPESAKFDEIHRYLLWASDGINGGIRDLRPEGNRLVVFERRGGQI